MIPLSVDQLTQVQYVQTQQIKQTSGVIIQQLPLEQLVQQRVEGKIQGRWLSKVFMDAVDVDNFDDVKHMLKTYGKGFYDAEAAIKLELSNAIAWAAGKGSLAMVELLLKECDQHPKAKAASVQILKECSQNPEAKAAALQILEEWGQNPEAIAAALQKLKECGQNPEAIAVALQKLKKYGQSPKAIATALEIYCAFGWAADNNHYAVVMLLLKKFGQNLEARDVLRIDRFIEDAFRVKHFGVVNLLLSACVESKNKMVLNHLFSSTIPQLIIQKNNKTSNKKTEFCENDSSNIQINQENKLKPGINVHTGELIVKQNDQLAKAYGKLVDRLFDLSLTTEEFMQFFTEENFFANLQTQQTAQGLYLLGLCYHYGIGTEVDERQAFLNYKKAAELNYPKAQHKLGICYRNGIGINKDAVSDEKIADLFQKAADQGFAVSQHNLAVCYEDGRGVEKNLLKADDFYQKAADQGFAPAQNRRDIISVEVGKRKNFLRYKDAAELGNAEAQNELGNCYLYGTGVTRNDGEAAKWYKKASDQGFAPAQNNYANCCELGRGVKQDLPEAANLYQKAAAQEIAAAQYNFGRFCHKGIGGVPESIVEAIKWYQKAADQGSATAQYELAVCYQYGSIGVARNLSKAIALYEMAAVQGLADAQYSLGCILQEGTGGTFIDIVKAVTWYQKAAKQGHSKAQNRLDYLRPCPE